MKNLFLLLSVGILLFSTSCTVNKRAHRPGYNVEWHSANPKPQKHPKAEEQEAAPVLETEAFVEESGTVEENTGIAEIQALVEDENALAGGEKHSGILNYERKLEKWSEGRKEDIKPESKSNEQEAQPQQRNSQADNLALWGFISSLAGLFLLPGVGSIVGLTLSAVALNKMRDNPVAHRYRGLAIAGLIIGIVGVLFWSFWIVGMVFWWW